MKRVRKKTVTPESVAHLFFPYRPEGREDLLQDLQQSLLPAGGDVVLGQLEEGKAVLTLTPHMLQTQINTD